MKRQISEWEKIIGNKTSDKGLIFKVYKQLIQLNIRKEKKKKTKQNPQQKQPNQKIGRRPKQKLLQRRHTYFQKAHEKCSISLIIRAMKIKTTMRYHLIHTNQMAIIKNSTTNKCWRGCGKKGTLLHSW